jgi:hypothetical protein
MIAALVYSPVLDWKSPEEKRIYMLFKLLEFVPPKLFLRSLGLQGFLIIS